MLLADLVRTSAAVAATRSRRQKIAFLADCLRRLPPAETGTGAAWLTGTLRQGRVGIGPALLRAARGAPAASAPALTIAEVERTCERLAALAGAGVRTEQGRLLTDLFSRATGAEQDFLYRLLLGELRQGALEAIIAEAVAAAADVPAAEVQRALMLAGALPPVAAAALTEGLPGLRRFDLQLFRPLLPMLAHSADALPAALTRLGTAALEWKLDGARVQVHKGGDEVRVYSRRLNEVTAAVPEIVEAVRALPARELILDGEALALGADGTPLPFQATMRRFGRKLDVAGLRAQLPLSPFFFDCLLRDGESLLPSPEAERFGALADLLPAGLLVPRLVTADPAQAQAFLAAALGRGHEGVLAKAPAAPYEAGRRGYQWLKVKQAHTLDLVVLAAEWGSGRRQGWLSNLHLGARDPAGGFVMLGKTFKGMTDAMLAWQTQKLLELAVARDATTVYVRPELVVEIDFNEIQHSPRYPGGLALRFARVKSYRPDKRPQDADSLATVRALARGAGGLNTEDGRAV